MNFELTQFAIDSHFDPDKAGTTINMSPELFLSNASAMEPVIIHDGYAPFCKLLFIENFTDACVGTMQIKPENERFLRSAYKNRKPEELPVLVRWFEGLPSETSELNRKEFVTVPRARYLGLVLYSKEQLAKEGTPIDADWGVVAILGQMYSDEEPMTPMTAMRNALGVKEGGSGVPLDREAYQLSVEFWNAHAAVKM